MVRGRICQSQRCCWIISSVRAQMLPIAPAAQPRPAAQTRMVSAGDFWPSQQELSRYLKYMARTRIPEFESDMPSHAVRSPWASGPATNTGTLHTLGPKSEGRLRKRPRSGLTAWKKSPSRSPWGLSSTSRKSGPWLQRPYLWEQLIKITGQLVEHAAVQSDLPTLVGGFVMETLGYCAAGLAEIPERIDRSAIRHFPQLWESLVRLQIYADNVFNDLVGAVDHC